MIILMKELIPNETPTVSFSSLADIHGNFHIDLPEPADCFLFAGDIFLKRGGDRKQQLIQQYEDLPDALEFLRSIPAELIVMIAGNHDYLFELLGKETTNYVLNNYGLLRGEEAPEIIYLENDSVEFKGKTIWGTPHSAFEEEKKWPRTHAFVLDGDDYIEQVQLPEVDIILSHSSPEYSGIADHPRAASHLQKEIERVCPEVLVSGHFHWMRGEHRIGDTKAFVPAATQPYREGVVPYSVFEEDLYFYFEL